MKLITFLEEADYSETTFVWRNKEHTSRFAPAASCRFLKTDSLVVFLTEDAREKDYPAFQAALPPDTTLEPVIIPAGSDPDELLQIALAVNDSVERGEEIVFDITHGPLSFPLIGLMVAIFMRISRDVSLKAILYGAYGIDRGVPTGKTPIFDLGPMLSWIEWSAAVDRFNETADARSLVALVREQRRNLARETKGDKDILRQLGNLGKLAGVLDSISESLHMIRPHQAMRHIADLPDRIQGAELVLQSTTTFLPYSVLFERIAAAYAPLAHTAPSHPENIEMTLEIEREMINWYAGRELWVEAITLSREWLVNWVMVQLGLHDITHLNTRHRIESVLSAEASDYRKAGEGRQPYNCIFLCDLPQVEDVLTLWLGLGEVRNDINHAGMRDKPGKPETLRRRIQECVQAINRLPV